MSASGERRNGVTRLLNERTGLVMAPLKHEPNAALEFEVAQQSAVFRLDTNRLARRARGGG